MKCFFSNTLLLLLFTFFIFNPRIHSEENKFLLNIPSAEYKLSDIIDSAGRKNYLIRDKVVLTLYKGDSVLHPNFTALSVSVNDDNTVKEPNEITNNQNAALLEPTKNYDDLDLLSQPMIFKGKNYMLCFAKY